VAGQVAAINVGVDVFRVLVSNNKRTIVALADRKRARKLVMLQIVRSTRTTTRTSSAIGSRATSPMAATTPLTPSQTFLR
jgi:leucine-rich repeat transmembrane neuronal protein 1/2